MNYFEKKRAKELLALQELLAHATVFLFEPYTIEKRGEDQWAVCNAGCCWSKSNEGFIYEPMPSSRTPEFIEDTRFELEEAIEIVQKLIEVGK